jgi:hypothetical protein
MQMPTLIQMISSGQMLLEWYSGMLNIDMLWDRVINSTKSIAGHFVTRSSLFDVNEVEFRTILRGQWNAGLKVINSFQWLPITCYRQAIDQSQITNEWTERFKTNLLIHTLYVELFGFEQIFPWGIYVEVAKGMVSRSVKVLSHIQQYDGMLFFCSHLDALAKRSERLLLKCNEVITQIILLQLLITIFSDKKVHKAEDDNEDAEEFEVPFIWMTRLSVILQELNTSLLMSLQTKLSEVYELQQQKPLPTLYDMSSRSNKCSKLDLLLNELEWVRLILEIVWLGCEYLSKPDWRMLNGFHDSHLPSMSITSWFTGFRDILEERLDIKRLHADIQMLTSSTADQVRTWFGLVGPSDSSCYEGIMGKYNNAHKSVQQACSQRLQSYHQYLRRGISKYKPPIIKTRFKPLHVDVESILCNHL